MYALCRAGCVYRIVFPFHSPCRGLWQSIYEFTARNKTNAKIRRLVVFHLPDSSAFFVSGNGAHAKAEQTRPNTIEPVDAHFVVNMHRLHSISAVCFLSLLSLYRITCEKL